MSPEALLVAVAVLPLLGAVLAGAVGAVRPEGDGPRFVSLGVLALGLVASLALWLVPGGGRWIAEIDQLWIPQLPVRLHLAVDGLSLPLVALTFAMGLVAVVASWREIDHRVGLFHADLLVLLAGVVWVFTALDLVLFYFAWEVMLVPMYLLIGVWGHEDRLRAAIKFFLFTQASGLLLLVAILGLHYAQLQQTGVSTFDLPQLLGTRLSGVAQVWLLLGFVAAFGTKLPLFPLHPWLPDAHTQASTGGSIVLAAVMLKTGAYGLLRFAVPLFPAASARLWPWLVGLGLVGVLYGAWLAAVQTDAKRLVAYTSVSHMGFVAMAVFAWNRVAVAGALLEMLAHALSTGGLFAVVGALEWRTGTRDLRELGGLWGSMPRFGTAALIFALGALGLPGLGNFLAEYLCLQGVFYAWPWLAALGTLGLVGATVYSLWLMQRTFYGPRPEGLDVVGRSDLVPREVAMFAGMALALLWLGVAPQPVLDRVGEAVPTELRRSR